MYPAERGALVVGSMIHAPTRPRPHFEKEAWSCACSSQRRAHLSITRDHPEGVGERARALALHKIVDRLGVHLDLALGVLIKAKREEVQQGL